MSEHFDDPTVCIAHGRFIPCRKDGEHRYTSNPYWVKSVRDYHGSDIAGLAWEPAWEVEQLAETDDTADWQRTTASRLGRGDHWPTTPVQCVCGWRETDPGAGTWVEHMTSGVVLTEAVRAYLRLYLLPANVASYLDPWDTHGRVADRCAPLLVEHVCSPAGGDA